MDSVEDSFDTIQPQDTWIKEVRRRYSEPQRHYHTNEHIDSMLLLANKHASHINDPEAVRLAIYFHDVVYDPTRSDNEVRSIEFFWQHAAAGDSEEKSKKVEKYIECTIKHEIPEDCADDGDLKLFLDFDLEVLGRASEEYERYAQQIRKEYIHIPDEVYRSGRSKVLEHFIRRDVLYFSDFFLSTHEEQARRNINRELQRLKGVQSQQVR